MLNCKLLIALLLLPLLVGAQQEKKLPIDSVAAELVRSIQQNAAETILLTTDKEIYVAGETLRIKALPVNTVNNKLTRKTKVLYADLVNDKDSVCAQILLNAGDIKTSGQIVLDKFLTTGFYWVRAYTKNMIASNENDISIIPVYIVSEPGGGIVRKNIQKTGETNQVIINMFPEGDNLISGTDNVVALQALNSYGEPLMVTGIVKDTKGAAVAKFSTNNNGLAKFVISPSWYGNYGVFVQRGDSYDSITSLPKVNLFAGQISVMQQNRYALKMRVMLEDSIYSKNYTTYLLGLHNDSLCFAGVGLGRYAVDIPVADFPGGIANLYLFNEAGKLLSQRSIYINKQNVNIAISTDKISYGARENVQMNIKVNDTNGKPLVASLTIAVTDAITNVTDDFSGEFFKDSLPDDTDLEMLVRKPVVINRDTTRDALAYADSLASLSGTVVNKDGKGIPGMQVLFLSAQGESVVLQDTTDANGRFHMAFSYMPDSTTFAVQVSDLKGKPMDYDVIIDSSLFPRLHTPGVLKEKFFTWQQKLLSAITEKHIDATIIDYEGNWLKTAMVTTSKKQRDISIESKHNIITQQMLIEKGYDNAGTAVVASGTFRILGGYLIAGGPNTQSGPAPTDEPLVVMDGQPMTVSSDGVTGSPVLSFLKTLYARDINYIKVLPVSQSALYGVRGGRGVIEIYSAKSTAYSQAKGNMKDIYVKGFSDDLFQIPDYSKKQMKNSKAADTRTTIYWNGYLFTDEHGDASVNFFTADPSATYLVTVTGVTAQGFKVYKTITISRK